MKKPPAYSVGGSSFVSTKTSGIILLAFFSHLCAGGVDNLMLVLMETLHDGQ
jgi:hypothetical protein